MLTHAVPIVTTVDYKAQKMEIHSALQQRLKRGDTWYEQYYKFVDCYMTDTVVNECTKVQNARQVAVRFYVLTRGALL